MLSSLGKRLVVPHCRSTLPSTSSLLSRSSLVRFFSSSFVVNKNKEHVVVALGGNALLRRGQDMTMENQRQNIRQGAASLKPILDSHKVTLVHGNGPQSGLLVLESSAYEKQTGLESMKLDVIDAETEGMIGYLLEQELQQYVDPSRGMATLLSQIVVDRNDPAFQNPTKFIGPVYTKQEAEKLKVPIKPDGEYYRRVVPSPRPMQMLDHEMRALRLLTDADSVVICAGGGGIPVVRRNGYLEGVEAVIDKDRAAAMVGTSLQANGLLILTDVQAVATDYKTDEQKWIKTVSADKLASLMDHFPAGSMGPKCESVIEFVRNCSSTTTSSTMTGCCWAAIGSLMQAGEILDGTAGTRIRNDLDKDFIEYYQD